MLGRWAVAITKPNAEQAVAQELRDLEINHHLFKRRSKIVKRAQPFDKLVPAWPGYIFVLTKGDDWDVIREVKGVQNFIHFGEFGPSFIPEPVMEELLHRCEEDDILPDDVLRCRFEFGQRLRITAQGLMNGYQVIFQFPLVQPGKVCVLQEWLGRWVPIELNECDLEEIDIRKRHKYRKRRKRKV